MTVPIFSSSCRRFASGLWEIKEEDTRKKLGKKKEKDEKEECEK